MSLLVRSSWSPDNSSKLIYLESPSSTSSWNDIFETRPKSPNLNWSFFICKQHKLIVRSSLERTIAKSPIKTRQTYKYVFWFDVQVNHTVAMNCNNDWVCSKIALDEKKMEEQSSKTSTLRNLLNSNARRISLRNFHRRCSVRTLWRWISSDKVEVQSSVWI